jgi:hypothetical protein
MPLDFANVNVAYWYTRACCPLLTHKIQIVTCGRKTLNIRIIITRFNLKLKPLANCFDLY